MIFFIEPIISDPGYGLRIPFFGCPLALALARSGLDARATHEERKRDRGRKGGEGKWQVPQVADGIDSGNGEWDGNGF